ncbi:DdrH [Deinococcus sp. KSM4-11]|uniref:DdrH n=1 Tax=Deinococcus sp. KSM4-11 TaxID=2568654 RepID=UPI0010A560DA|nr:DdrH [Deinococcus sp. KSM4-11]THF86432.1 DdrH [Deinococcus sp. KSM4-11]
MTNPATNNPYAEWFEKLRAEYGEQLGQMPLPDGLPEHLRSLIRSGDEDAIQFMLKLAWQFGAQVGYAAGARQNEEQASAFRPSRGVQA